MHVAGRLTPEQFWAHVDAVDDRMRASAHQLAMYGVDDGPPPFMTGAWSWENGVLTTVGLAYGERDGAGPWTQVLTTVADPATVVATLRMTALPHPQDEDGFRALDERLAATPVTATPIVVDGRPTTFDRCSDGPRWYASAQLGEHGVVVEARGVAPEHVRLVRVHDIEPYLAGRRAYLRAVRGER